MFTRSIRIIAMTINLLVITW